MFAYDCETTGPNPLVDRLVTAAIVLDIPGQDREVFTWICDPVIPIELGATAVHGISNEYVKEHGKSELEVVTDILQLFDQIYNQYGSIPLVVVNAIFDISILHLAIKRLGIGDGFNLDNHPIVDTLVIDRGIDPYRSARRTLTATCAAYGLSIEGAHRAEFDCIAAIRLSRKMAEKYPWIQTWNFDKMMRVQRIFARERAKQFQEYRLADVDNTFEGFEMEMGWPILDGAI